ncbi:P-loop containing nucleoside triphosphate hydrolase protein [Phlegmacium glaucopus]|nr:P-loop containing nucleoside triphosphate hydrolase protein [Phlegmacium glaucopus]
MPPRKGIVKSGNAGNSSKLKNPVTSVPTAPGSDTPPPLFPPGSKYPLSLLNERCQKEGWEKPVVDTQHRGSEGWSFAVTLSRHNKKTSQRETVRLEPHPPYLRPTALEAKHWGATYALYRVRADKLFIDTTPLFCNGIQLHLVLPAGPKDYWNELAAEHKAIPDHQKWMYEADPFLAQQEVKKRQAKAAERREEAVSNPSTVDVRKSASSNEFSQSPEVRMAGSLRELVEYAIKEELSLNPGADESDDAPAVLSQENIPELSVQLGHLGFLKAQIRNATEFLSQSSALSSKLLGSLSPLEACIEYLILHIPECDLPQRFLPSNNSSNPFITSAHAGEHDLQRRWIEEKAVKEAGWPPQAVKECTADPRFIQSWDLLMVVLGKRLIGQHMGETASTNSSAAYLIEEGEYAAFGARLEEPGHLVLPLFSAPIDIHILFSIDECYPRPGYLPIFVTSSTVPAYIRLHLLSRFLSTLELQSGLLADEGFCMSVMRIFEGEWALVEDNGPPDISAVLEHLVPRPQRSATNASKFYSLNTNDNPNFHQEKKARRLRVKHDDARLKRELEAVQKTEKFKVVLEERKRLPAFKAKQDFLDKLEKNRVVVVVGETGCGKTTQVPQFILDSLILSNCGSETSIIVTQPRRISAISVAARVSQERLEDGSVGYAIRGESKQNENTKLLFCTTGVVLRRLSTGDNLEHVSHIVVDEVHERSLDGDFLLLELKELLKSHPTLKVVLMSATINHETFVKYFNNAPLLTIPGFAHPVKDIYLEEVIPNLNYRPSTGSVKSRGKEDDALLEEYRAQGLEDPHIIVIQNLIRSQRIDYQLITALINYIISTATTRGGILIFLPGVSEIKQCIDSIRKEGHQKDVTVLPLHANLSNDEQRRVFEKTTTWKIIAATNVAETSITIDDVIYVIDAGKVKETQYDPETSLSRLVETWVTRAAAKQRRGRAGRTQPGTCYKLYTKKQEMNMAKFPVPEILRVPLESISLAVKATKEDQDIKVFLSQAIDPPSIAAMDRALAILEELGAIDNTGTLTALGKHISMLPLDIRLAKMLILATVFQCLGPIVTVAALLSSKPLFLTPLEKRDEAAAARARFLSGNSDLLTDVSAFHQCLKMRTEKKSQSVIKSFCEENFISLTTLREVTSLRQDFVSSLAEIGFVPLDSTPSTPGLNSCSENTNLVKAVMLGGLWPRVARVRLPKGAIKFDKVSAGTIQRENSAKEFKMYDLREGRVFLHPGSVLFGASVWKSPFLFYFHKHMTSKVFLRDASEVPLYALLLFGGQVAVNHVLGGLTVGNKESFIKLRAWPRIGVLVNQLRRLLDAQLQKCIEEGTMLNTRSGNPIVHAIMALLTHDGLSE